VTDNNLERDPFLDMSEAPQQLGGNIVDTTGMITFKDFGLGVGSIGIEGRTDIERAKLQQMVEGLAGGEFNVPVNQVVPIGCVDGRTKEDGSREEVPCAAGGSLSTVYALALADDGHMSDMSELELTKNTLQLMSSRGHETGVHGDDHGPCGCGACAKAGEVFKYITEKSDAIITALSALGVVVTDEQKQLIVKNADTKLSQGNFFAEDRSSILAAAQNVGAGYEALVGQHNELLVAINTVEGTTIDRTKIRDLYGAQYDIFVLDAWSIRKAAEAASTTGYPEETENISAAMFMQNVATAAVLGNGSLGIVTVTQIV